MFRLYMFLRFYNSAFNSFTLGTFFLQSFLDTPAYSSPHPLDDLHHLIADIVWMEHFHIVAIAADFLIEVISGMQAVGEYGVSILRAVVQYPLAAVQGSVLEVRGKAL